MYFLQYDARTVGAYGHGGEYVVQTGFGWTNGGVLRLLELFPKELTAPGATVRHGRAFRMREGTRLQHT